MFRANQFVRSTAGLTPSEYPLPKKRLRVLAALLAGAALLSTGCEKKEQAATPPPDVEVVEVAKKDVPITKDWVATMDGFVNAPIRAQVSGLLLKQNYTNGAFVRKGAPLFQIDPRPFQAALEQAKGNVEQAKGNLAEAQGNLQVAQARLGKTQLDVARYTPLAKESAISQQELDDAIQADLAAKAQVEANKAAIEAAKATIVAASAAVDTAQLNLGFTTIVSPIDGVSAISTAQVGDLVGPQSGALTTVSTVDPIKVNFNPSEQEYLAVSRVREVLHMSQEKFERDLEFRLTLADGSTFSQKGRMYAINREVDVRTGAILVQTVFPNPGNVLRPGGFGGISTVVRIQQGALLVPQRAVNEMQGTYLLAVVGSENKVSLRPVKVGPKVGSMWIIDEGVKPGERVVAEGVQSVREGLQVNPKPYLSGSQGKKS
jgi:membrane fusion protein, multidrug efflux system